MIPEKLQEIIDEFKELENNEEKFEVLMEYGEKLKGLEQKYKTQENLVLGCTSTVHIIANIKNEKVYFSGEADSLLIKGLVQILIEGLNGTLIKELLNLDEDFLTIFGLTQSITSSRANASKNIFSKMKEQVQKELKK